MQLHDINFPTISSDFILIFKSNFQHAGIEKSLLLDFRQCVFCQLFEIWQTLHHLGAKNVGLFTCVHFASLDLFQLIIVAKELRIFLEPFLVGLSWSG